jgi:HEAT repeat protein
MGFQAFLMDKLTQETVNSMLLQQDMEFQTNFNHTNTLLHSMIANAPEPELLAAGTQAINSEDPRRRILGIRLIRELKQYASESFAQLARMLGIEHDQEVIYWIVGAFGFLKSDLVANQLRGLASHPNPGVRYNVATALANCASDEMPEDSLEVLLSLASDENAEVRFSAIFELGSWRKVNRDPRIESALRHAINTDDDQLVVRAAQDAIQEDIG